MDKQYEYHNLDIEFESQYTKNGLFAFIKAEDTSFKRMLSNIINNSVEAIESKSGKITLMLDVNNEEVKISITDTGKGMIESTLDKIRNRVSFSQGKVNGHGIGFNQIYETLEQINGNIIIDSRVGVGTTITLIISRIKTPRWVAEEIEVMPNDIVVILDDDNSIHGAWDIRFAEILKTSQGLRVEHFKQAVDVINFIGSLTDSEKRRIFLLTDYELLKQNLNGLDVISKTKIERSLLVTSHYSSLNVKEHAYKTNTKILPKILAPKININLLQ